MSYVDIIFLAFALSIDACLVSFSYGLVFNKNYLKNSFLLALFTGFFQGLMPLIGYYLASILKHYVQNYAKIIVLIIFSYLGIKFIKEAFEVEKNKNLCIDLKCLFLIGIATSIDAFSAGITLMLIGNDILRPIVIIGIVTFINSLLGFYVGNKLRHIPTKFLEILAGILLIFLGIKSFLLF